MPFRSEPKTPVQAAHSLSLPPLAVLNLALSKIVRDFSSNREIVQQRTMCLSSWIALHSPSP